jgi:protocatechuate 3,4-dioxygenase beta subunit
MFRSGAAAVAAYLLTQTAPGAEPNRYDGGPCASAGASATLVQPGEPGPSLTVSGVVYRPDGQTPAPGVTLYVYQTDVRGLYNEPGQATPRIHGWMKTDGQGRYSYRTIRPGAYPNNRIPAHIHTQLWGPDVPPQWNEDLNFADDPFLPASDAARSATLGVFAFVASPRTADGGLHAVHNLRLKAHGDRFESNILHGLRPCERSR